MTRTNMLCHTIIILLCRLLLHHFWKVLSLQSVRFCGTAQEYFWWKVVPFSYLHWKSPRITNIEIMKTIWRREEQLVTHACLFVLKNYVIFQRRSEKGPSWWNKRHWRFKNCFNFAKIACIIIRKRLTNYRFAKHSYRFGTNNYSTRDLLIERFNHHWKLTNKRRFCNNLRTGMIPFRTISCVQYISGQIQGLSFSWDRK